MLVVERLKKSFGEVAAVRGVSFTLAPGEVLGFLGPNGAGKTTTMRMIAGYLEPDDGHASIDGCDVTESRTEAQRRLGYLPEGAPAYPEMTPLDFLAFSARARGIAPANVSGAVRRAADLVELGAAERRPIEALSKGFKRRVGLAAALIHEPPVLILDEPTDGLDPNQKHAVRALIRELAETTAIIVSTHILEEVDAVCTRAMVIDQGEVRADETPEGLAARHPSGKLEEVFRSLTTPESDILGELDEDDA
ncbi:MAG: ABC transporter ATP-binding protein [Maricaulaceae bacterium]|jgi:ABC-2 type transport system ATP-binding protein